MMPIPFQPVPRRLACALVSCLVLVGASPARGDKPRVLVTPFTGGPEATAAEQVVSMALSRTYQVITSGAPASAPARPAAGKGKKKKGGAAAAGPSAGGIPDDVVAVVDGALVKRRRMIVNIRGRNVPDTTLGWPVNGSMTRATYERIATEVPPVVDALVSASGRGAPAATPSSKPPASEPPATPAPKSSTSPPPAPRVAEKASEPAKTEPEKAEPEKTERPAVVEHERRSGGRRPSWAPFVDVAGSLLVTRRSFAFAQPELPSFTSGSNAGLGLEATLFPFAGMWKGGAGARALAGLGIGLTAEYHFRPDSTPNPCTNLDTGGACLDHYATSESRIEGGLRWRWNVAGRDDRPDLRASLEYGAHGFSIAKRTETRMDGTTFQADAGPPDVDYRYLSLGLGTRVPFAGRFAISAGLRYLALLDQGPLGSAAGYGSFGPSGGYGLRIGLGAEVRLTAGLHLGLDGFYEHMGLSFTAPPSAGVSMTVPPCGTPLPCGTTDGASDEYLGGALSLRYRY